MSILYTDLERLPEALAADVLIRFAIMELGAVIYLTELPEETPADEANWEEHP